MDVSRKHFTNIEAGKMFARGPMNTFSHARTFPPATFRGATHPNFDTLYSLAWLDLTKEPVVIAVPDTRGRYYLLQLLDMWMDSFAGVGKRTTGTKLVDLLLVPPKNAMPTPGIRPSRIVPFRAWPPPEFAVTRWWSKMDSNCRSRSFGGESGRFLAVSVSPSADRRLKRTGERLASDCDQSDVWVCPTKERADMKRNPSRSGTKGLTDELAELRGLDSTALKQRWRVLYRTEAPAHIGQSLLLQAVAYRLQERALGGVKSSTRRLLERVAEDKVRLRPATETPRITPGSVLIREWHGVSHRVTVLEDGLLLRGARYRSLSEVARKITGTRWSGPRFFGLRAPAKGSDHGTR
jgi:hypothetical protein